MHVVVINHWKEETAEFAQEISMALANTVFEVQQRMICGIPTVIGCYADPQQALAIAQKLDQIGMKTMVVDATKVRNRTGAVVVRRFALNESSLYIETDDRRCAEIPYGKIDALLPATCNIKYSETKTNVERKLSLGKTLLMGGIPIYSNVKHQQKIKTEMYNKVLYLYVSKRLQPIIFSQEDMLYDGLGDAMKLTRELNFTFLTDELHRRSPGAIYEDRLLRRVGQTRLLGPTLNPEANIDLAAEILIQSLRLSSNSNNTVSS